MSAVVSTASPKGRLDVLCDSLGIRLVPVWRRRLPGQSHARGTMKETRDSHDEGHLVLTIRCIRETKPNREELWSETIGAVSDVLLSRPEWQERPSDLFDALDRIDLGAMREEARQRRPWPVRQTMRVLLHAAIEGRIGDATLDRR